MNKKALEKMRKLASRITSSNPTGTHTGSGKKEVAEYWKAREQKKKIPLLKAKESRKNPEFAKMSIEEYEKKYGK
jgi:hypothetical protein